MTLLRSLVALLALACARGDGTGQATFDGRVVCVPEARTIDLAPGSQPRPADAVGACRTWPDQALIDARVRQTCGPCGFVFDAVATRGQRTGGTPDACCYRVSSPPPPPPR